MYAISKYVLIFMLLKSSSLFRKQVLNVVDQFGLIIVVVVVVILTSDTGESVAAGPFNADWSELLLLPQTSLWKWSIVMHKNCMVILSDLQLCFFFLLYQGL